jgi:hypothetical protein
MPPGRVDVAALHVVDAIVIREMAALVRQATGFAPVNRITVASHEATPYLFTDRIVTRYGREE